jgi:pimeloyl-ACP methyl ester carboxylesterase
MIPDHRGTGNSSKLCPVEEAADSPDGMGLAGEEWGSCIGAFYQDPARAQAFTITNAARDLALLISRYREAGEVQVYGVSYGTQLVLRMMQVAPPALDGVILDGLAPLESAAQEDLGHRTAVVDAVGRALLDAEQEAAYAALLAGATPGTPWLAQVPGGDLRRFMGTLLTFPGLRSRIPAIVEGLSRGETAALERTHADLVAMAGELGRYPQSSPSLPLVMLISGSENNGRRDLDAATVAAEEKDALFVSPLPGFLAANPLPLYARDQWFGGAPASLPRTLVLHGTLDPNTPYEGAVAHVARLREAGPVQLSTVRGGAHFLLFVAPQCFVETAGAVVAGADAPALCIAE